MSEIFVKGLKQKLRFDLTGNIGIEDLFTANYEALVAYEEALTKKVEVFGKSTRRTSSYKTVAQQKVELQLSIVTAVLNERDTDMATAENAAEIKVHNQKIMELIKAQENKQLESLSADELRKMLK